MHSTYTYILTPLGCDTVAVCFISTAENLLDTYIPNQKIFFSFNFSLIFPPLLRPQQSRDLVSDSFSTAQSVVELLNCEITWAFCTSSTDRPRKKKSRARTPATEKARVTCESTQVFSAKNFVSNLRLSSELQSRQLFDT